MVGKVKRTALKNTKTSRFKANCELDRYYSVRQICDFMNKHVEPTTILQSKTIYESLNRGRCHATKTIRCDGSGDLRICVLSGGEIDTNEHRISATPPAMLMRLNLPTIKVWYQRHLVSASMVEPMIARKIVLSATSSLLNQMADGSGSLKLEGSVKHVLAWNPSGCNGDLALLIAD